MSENSVSNPVPKPKKKYHYTKKTGRPSSYDPKYCDELIKFFSVEHFEEKVVARVTGKNDYEKEEFKEIANKIPFINAFARKIGVSHDTLYEWARVHPEFSASMSRAKDLQAEMIVSNALKGLYQPHFAFFAMKNMHGWKDKTEIDHGITDESYEKLKAIPVEELKKELNDLFPVNLKRISVN